MTEQPVGPRCGNNPNVQLTPGDRKAIDDFKARLALQASAKPYIDNAVWVDGDPLMEVVAATVWERCARDDEDMPQMVCDDPRTIAAFAAAVARAQAAAPSVTADRAAIYRELAHLQERTAATDVIRRRRSIATGRRLFAVELRRMADEAQQTEHTPEPS